MRIYAQMPEQTHACIDQIHRCVCMHIIGTREQRSISTKFLTLEDMCQIKEMHARASVHAHACTNIHTHSHMHTQNKHTLVELQHELQARPPSRTLVCTSSLVPAAISLAAVSV